MSATSVASLEAFTSIFAFYAAGDAPLALTCSSPAARVAGEMTAFMQRPRAAQAAVGGRLEMVGMDPCEGERVATIADMQQFERAVWWLTRRRSSYRAEPFPLRSVRFCVDAALESSMDVVARVPLCAATVTTLNLNARCDTCNHIPSLRAISHMVGLRELLMKHTTVLQSPRQLPLAMTHELHAVFRNLRKLVVGDYYLVQHLPLRDLVFLEEVDLSGTGVTSAVVEALASCTRIHALKLRGCISIESFRPLSALTRLSHLDVSFTRIRDGELQHLCHHCPRLSSLRLCRCEALTDFSPLNALDQLRQLHVGRTAFRNSDLERVCALPCVEELHIDACRLVDVFTPLANSHRLRDLNARETWMDDAGVAALANCSHLTRINLSNCTVAGTFAALAQLTRVEHLNLSSTRVTDACLAALCCCSTSLLRTLLLNGCRALHDFTPLRHLDAVEEVGVCDTAFDDVAVQAVAQCAKLTRLHLHICIGISSLAPLSACAHLCYLGIGGTRFSNRCAEGDCCKLRDRGVQLNHQLFLVTAF